MVAPSRWNSARDASPCGRRSCCSPDQVGRGALDPGEPVGDGGRRSPANVRDRVQATKAVPAGSAARRAGPACFACGRSPASSARRLWQPITKPKPGGGFVPPSDSRGGGGRGGEQPGRSPAMKAQGLRRIFEGEERESAAPRRRGVSSAGPPAKARKAPPERPRRGQSCATSAPSFGRCRAFAMAASAPWRPGSGHAGRASPIQHAPGIRETKPSSAWAPMQPRIGGARPASSARLRGARAVERPHSEGRPALPASAGCGVVPLWRSPVDGR